MYGRSESKNFLAKGRHVQKKVQKPLFYFCHITHNAGYSSAVNGFDWHGEHQAMIWNGSLGVCFPVLTLLRGRSNKVEGAYLRFKTWDGKKYSEFCHLVLKPT